MNWKQVLLKTHGVPLFQEQAMRLAIEAAKFTDDEADGLRRSMATFRADGRLWTYREKFIEGMVRRGYQRDFAERCFKQIEGFGAYGFPESHAISFAILVYVSAWVKHHHPEAFCASLLNSQPMGFYQPAPTGPRDAGASTGWRCARRTSSPATGTAPWSRRTIPGRRAGRFAWAFARSRGSRRMTLWPS